MNAMVVFESMYGNTRAIAEAVAEGLGGATCAPAHEAGDAAADTDLLVVGGPTHIHGMAGTRSRQGAVEAAKKDGAQLEAGATAEPDLRTWLNRLPRADNTCAAAFDTRIGKPSWLVGSASRGIAKRLRRHGYDVIDDASFIVRDAEGPLAEGELARARHWGEQLAQSISLSASAAPR